MLNTGQLNDVQKSIQTAPMMLLHCIGYNKFSIPFYLTLYLST